MAAMTDLLPYNATKAERALSEAIARLSDVPIRVRDVWNPETCPAALLPWLAWAFSVDEWDPAWTEQQKRAAIAASVEVHRRKGTAGAVRRAVESLGLGAEFSEWFDHGGDPYTFRLLIEASQYQLRHASLLRLIEVVEATKNLRSHYEIVLRTRSRAGESVLGATCIGHIVMIPYGGGAGIVGQEVMLAATVSGHSYTFVVAEED